MWGIHFFVGAWDGANNTTGNVVLNMNNNIFGWSTTNAGGHLFVVGRDAGTYGRVIISNMGAGSFVGHTVNNDHDFYVGENGGSGHVEFVGGQWGGRLSQLRVGGDGAGLGYFDASTATLSNLNVNFVRIGNDGNRTGQVFLAGGTMTINNELSLGHSGTGRGLLSLSNMTVNVAPAFTVNNNSVLRLENTTVNNAGTMTINGNGWMGSDGVLRNVSGNSTITGTVDKASAVTIRVDSGSLTLGGNFTGNQNMTLTGDGILRLNGVSTHNVGTVSGGTLELNNTNHTFNGGLTVQSGGGLQGNNARITGSVRSRATRLSRQGQTALLAH
ncbi:hypothetical protein QPK87_30135 [Kamptonema cortianum]|nr:hypothetical protein [Kamptonema cortianum]